MKKFRYFMQIAYSPNNALITVSCRLRGGCERLRQNVGDPKDQDSVSAQAVIGNHDQQNRHAEYEGRKSVTPIKPFSDEVASGSAECECQQNGYPVEHFPPRRTNAVDGERFLACMPEQEGGSEGDGKNGCAGLERHVELIGQVICDQGADNADEHHCSPVQPGNIAPDGELCAQNDDEQATHEPGGIGQSKMQINRKEVGGGFADSRCQNLDDPETYRDNNGHFDAIRPATSRFEALHCHNGPAFRFNSCPSGAGLRPNSRPTE